MLSVFITIALDQTNYVENDFAKIKEIKKRIRMGWKLLKLEHLNYHTPEMIFLWSNNSVTSHWLSNLYKSNLWKLCQICLKQDTSIFLSDHNLNSPKMKINAYLAMLIPLNTHKTNQSVFQPQSYKKYEWTSYFIHIQMHKMSFKNYHCRKSVF